MQEQYTSYVKEHLNHLYFKDTRPPWLFVIPAGIAFGGHRVQRSSYWGGDPAKSLVAQQFRASV